VTNIKEQLIQQITQQQKLIINTFLNFIFFILTIYNKNKSFSLSQETKYNAFFTEKILKKI